MTARSTSVATYGAVGDGIANDTQPIQRAIDTTAAAGGGTVRLPSGVYVSGTLVLRDDVTLHLDSGAVLRASLDRADYIAAPVYVAAWPPGIRREALIFAQGVRNIAVTGSGCVDGRDTEFWIQHPPPLPTTRVHYRPTGWRPHLILFDNCRDVRIADLTLRRAPIYAAWIVESEHVEVTGLRVLSNFFGPNTDGIHLSSTRHVSIHDCQFTVGDDAIAIDGGGVGPCEDVLVQRCRFRTLTAMARVYTGLGRWLDDASDDVGAVRNIRFRHCVVEEAKAVLNLIADRGTVEDVSITDVDVALQLPGTPIYIVADRGSVRDVEVRRMRASSCNGVLTAAGGVDDVLDGVQLVDCEFTVRPVSKQFGLGLPTPVDGDDRVEPRWRALVRRRSLLSDYHGAPYNVFLRNVGRCSLEGVTINLCGGIPGAQWSGIHAEQVDDLELRNVVVGPSGNEGQRPAVDLIGVGTATIEACTAQPGTTVFVRVADGTERVHLGCNAVGSAVPIDLAAGISPDVVQHLA